MTNTDCLVIGAGVIGSSIAYHLARKGMQVLVVERADVASEPTASWASAGGVRRQGRNPAEGLLASEAIARWPRLADELDADLHYRQGGNLLVAENRIESEKLIAFVAAQQIMGFTDVRLLQQTELHALVPALASHVIAASYSPADGQADPRLTTRAFAAAAQWHGARYWLETECEQLLGTKQRVTGARTSRGDVSAATVVLAAGAWSDELTRPLDLRLPIRMGALQMILTTPAPADLLRPVLSPMGRSLSLKQLASGAFLLGGGWPGEVRPDRRGYRVQPQSVTDNWDIAVSILPAVGAQRIERAWCGLEAMSVDGLPYVGPVPSTEGLYFATGFSGHGFALSPAVGRAVADEIAGASAPELDRVRPARIPNYDEAFLY